MIVSPGAPTWVAPSPEDLPDLRLEMTEQMATHPHSREIWRRIVGSSFPLVPTAPDPLEEPATAYVLGGEVMTRIEQRRLREAQLYWVDEDMTSLSLAAAATPPQEPVKASRMPAEAGLMLFAQPIGVHDYSMSTIVTTPPYVAVPNLDDGLVLAQSIVAVSWSTWRPAHLELDAQPGRHRWSSWHPQMGLPIPLPGDFEGVWLTFWITSAIGWDTLPPNKPIATNVLLFNQPLFVDERSCSSEWAQVVYTAWQLMSQTGNAQLTETQTVPRRRAGLRRDTRASIPTPGTVNVVRVHTRHRPSPEARAQDAATSHNRRAPNWTHRWPVRPYRRNTCLNPRAHAEDGCEHEERVVPGQIRGPADKPLVVRNRVHLWDTPPPTG